MAHHIQFQLTFFPNPYSNEYCSIGISSIKRNVARAPDIFELNIANRFDKSGSFFLHKPAASFVE